MHITVDHAELRLEGDARWWCLAQDIEPDNGDAYPWYHLFPDDIFEWRCAEYGIDHDDTDTLLDVVLFEPYLDHGAADPDLTHLDAPSVAAARDYHLARIRQVKTHHGRLKGRPGLSTRIIPVEQRPVRMHVVLESAAEDPLDVVLRESPRSPEHIAVKRELMTYHRDLRQEQLRAQRRAGPREWRRETPDELRARIMPKRGNPGDG